MGKLIRIVKCPNGYSVCFIIATLILIGVLLLWQATSQTQQFIKQQKLLAKQSVTGAANEISAYLDDLKYQVVLFSQDEIALLRKLAQDPDNNQIIDEMELEVASHFPNHFAITIADAGGTPILGNFDLQINELCQSDIKKFALSGFKYDVFIHPHPETQHFDIMTPVDLYGQNTPGSNEVLFISFKPTNIQRYLGNAQIFGHTLYLLKDNIDGLIELTAEGTRVDLIKQNKDHILSDEILNRIDYMTPVRGTKWNLASIADTSLYSEQMHKIAIRAIYIFLFFILISIMYLSLLFHFEKKRKLADLTLKQTKELLQHTLNFSRTGTWEYDSNHDQLHWSNDAQSILINHNPANLKEYLSITHMEDRAGLASYFKDCITSGQPRTLEHRILTPDNNIYWVELSGAVDKDVAPSSRILGLIRDITQRKQAEQVRLEDEKRQRETLIREVHHRIKNNLQGVIGLLRRQSNKDELNHTILNHAISQLNSVSLIHGLSCETKETKISLLELISAITEAANNFTGANIKPRLPSDAPACYLQNEDSAVAVALIVNELIFNAIKHSPQNARPIITELHCMDNCAEITVANPATIGRMPKIWDSAPA